MNRSSQYRQRFAAVLANAASYAFEVDVSSGNEEPSVVLSDHLRSVHWRARNAERIKRVDDQVFSQVIARIEALLIHPDA